MAQVTVQLPSWKLLWRLSREVRKYFRELDHLENLVKERARVSRDIRKKIASYKEMIKEAYNNLLKGNYKDEKEALSYILTIKQANEKIEEIMNSPEVKSKIEAKEKLSDEIKETRKEVKKSRKIIEDILEVPEVQHFISLNESELP